MVSFDRRLRQHSGPANKHKPQWSLPSDELVPKAWRLPGSSANHTPSMHAMAFCLLRQCLSVGMACCSYKVLQCCPFLSFLLSFQSHYHCSTIRRLAILLGASYPIARLSAASHLVAITLAAYRLYRSDSLPRSILLSKVHNDNGVTMPSKVSNGAQGVQPVVVEVKPRNVAPSSPSPPPSPKAVRFAPSASRQLSNTEEWSLWHFEHHASKCKTCYDPLGAYRENARLCPEGHALAQDVAINVCYKDGDIYATRKEQHKLVRVEIKPGYWHVLGLLKSMDHHLRSSSSRRQPIISYDRNYPVSARYPKERKSEYQSDQRDRRETVIIEPASSRPERRSSHRGSRHPGKRYDTVVVDDDVEAPRPSPSSPTTKYKEHRGSLYKDEMARLEREKRYRVEVREPESSSSSRRRREERRKERYE